MTQLELNFESKGQIPACIEEMQAVSPVTFTYEIRNAPWTTHIMAIPEYMDVQEQACLAFKSEEDCKYFMKTKKCREIFEKYASPKIG